MNTFCKLGLKALPLALILCSLSFAKTVLADTRIVFLGGIATASYTGPVAGLQGAVRGTGTTYNHQVVDFQLPGIYWATEATRSIYGIMPKFYQDLNSNVSNVPGSTNLTVYNAELSFSYLYALGRGDSGVSFFRFDLGPSALRAISTDAVSGTNISQTDYYGASAMAGLGITVRLGHLMALVLNANYFYAAYTSVTAQGLRLDLGFMF